MRLAGCIDRGLDIAREPLAQVGRYVKDLQAVDDTLKPNTNVTGEERETQFILLRQQWQSSADPIAQHFAKMMSSFEPACLWVARQPMCQPTIWTWSVGSKDPKATSVGCMAVVMRACGSCVKVQH
jgi:hypothetical protein